MSASIVSRPCLAAAAASRARLVSRAARASTASSSSNDKLHARAHPIQVRGLAQIARAKKGGFMAEMEEAKAEESGAKVEFTLPLAIQKYPHASLRNDNKIVGVFDSDLEKLAQAMFKIMYDTEGVGLAAPQVGVNYRMMVYNEAGEPGRGKEVVLVNPKIVKFSKTKDLFEEGCLSFPKIYADVERPTSVQVEAQNLRGKKFKMTLDGFEARVFQHEYDHLDGVLFHDRMTDEVRGTVQGELDALIEAHPANEPKGV